MSDIKPALTAEEWEVYRDLVPSGVQSLDADLLLYKDGPQKLAALCLYGQNFGFTREDVRHLREANAAVLFSVPWRLALADRIEALLPPEKE